MAVVSNEKSHLFLFGRVSELQGHFLFLNPRSSALLVVIALGQERD